MEHETQIPIAHSLAEENYSYQLKGLGFMALESLRGISEIKSNNDCTGENWRTNVAVVGQSFQAFCFGLCCQVEADKENIPGGLDSAAFQITALGNFTVNRLKPSEIAQQGGLADQRAYVRQLGISIQDFCESIAAQICPEPSREGKLMSDGICDRGWDLKSVKDHVEAAKNTADCAYDIAEQNQRDIEELRERLEALEGKSNE